jgi:hypothetical protein
MRTDVSERLVVSIIAPSTANLYYFLSECRLYRNLRVEEEIAQ